MVSADAEAARQQAEDELSSVLGRDVHVRVGTRGAKIEIPLEDLADALEIARLLRGRLAA